MKQCVVVIPLYRSKPSNSEIASFKQVLSVLRNYDISIFTYDNLDLSIYEEISQYIGKSYSVEYFDKFYFSSVENYNRLCLDKDFYRRFSLYEYMLIYQLDAWVFRDELKYWCNKGYDYIGAPFLWPSAKKQYIHELAYVGNGGFSLRKVSYCLKVLSRFHFLPYLKPAGIIKDFYYNRYILYKGKIRKDHFINLVFFVLLKSIGIRNNLHYMFKSNINEDRILGCYAKDAWGIHANLPSVMEAVKFSFEVHPTFLYSLNGEKLPFGCHAFEKYEFENFWKRYIIIE